MRLHVARHTATARGKKYHYYACIDGRTEKLRKAPSESLRHRESVPSVLRGSAATLRGGPQLGSFVHQSRLARRFIPSPICSGVTAQKGSRTNLSPGTGPPSSGSAKN